MSTEVQPRRVLTVFPKELLGVLPPNAPPSLIFLIQRMSLYLIAKPEIAYEKLMNASEHAGKDLISALQASILSRGELRQGTEVSAGSGSYLRPDPPTRMSFGENDINRFISLWMSMFNRLADETLEAITKIGYDSD